MNMDSKVWYGLSEDDRNSYLAMFGRVLDFFGESAQEIRWSGALTEGGLQAVPGGKATQPPGAAHPVSGGGRWTGGMVF